MCGTDCQRQLRAWICARGFEDDPLVAGEELRELPGFWAAQLMWLSETQEHDAVPE
ncbi:hypothetical protein [Streptomyces rishiriensis]|uniref:hypothetical protein n=1 Tax=Streptomyces rishiriensis TaxID=68264 RepID=UPI0037D5F297